MSTISPAAQAREGQGAAVASRSPRPRRDARSGRQGHREPARTDDVPARAHGVELLGELPGSGYRRAPALVRRPDGQTLQLTRLLYLILEAIDDRRTYDQIATTVSQKAGRLISADNVRLLAESRLRPLGMLRLADGSEPAVRKANPLLALRLKVVVSNPRWTRRITAPFATLFRPYMVAAVVSAFLVTTGWVLFEKGLAAATYQAFDEPELLLLVFAITVVSAGFHEFGHAAACRYGGATPGAMGAGLYLIWPAFYTDVSDSYRLGRGGRVRVDVGGLYFNAIVAVATFAVWAVARWDALLLVVAAQVVQMLRQLAPFVRFDGYHILADLTGVPDLYTHIKPTLLGLLPTRWRRPEPTVLKPWARAVVTLWVLIVVPLLGLSLVLMVVVVLPRIAATAGQSVRRQWQGLGVNWAEGDAASVAVRLLSIIAISLPLLAIVYLLSRIVRRTTSSVARATAGRPWQRLAAAVVAAAVVAATGWAWWPDSDRYRPIEEHERGTLFEALPNPTQPVEVPLDPARTVATVWPATSAPPAREHPRLALVLVPRAPSPSTPAWVFPFDPPASPGDGDNQALAVNTRDGSAVYDVAFALVWVTDGAVDHVNAAYALASCRGCRTVAVAFQVVLAVGPADLVLPTNISAAVNYSCVQCLTYALATQLVVTLPNGLSDDALRELNVLWQQIEEFSQRIQDLPVEQIRGELAQYEAAILAVIREDVVPSPSGGQPHSSAAPGTSPATPGPDDTGGSPATPTPTSSPTGTASPTPYPTPSGSAPSTAPD